MSHGELSAVQLFQLCAGSSDNDAWDEFHSRFHRTIAGVVVRTLSISGTNATDQAADIIQDIYARLCQNGGKALRDFVPLGQNSEFAYLKVIARNAALSYRPNPGKEGSLTDSNLDSTEFEDPSFGKSMDRQILLGEIDKAVRDIAGERDRQVFWLYYRVGLTAQQISALPGTDLSAKGVESVLQRLTRAIKEKFMSNSEGKMRGIGFSV